MQKITKISSKRWSVLSCDKKIHVIQDLMPHDLYIYDALKALDCSILNKNDINKKVFKKEKAVFSFKKNNVEFEFDYDWYADSVEREMSFYMDDGEKIIWKKDQGFDKILFYKNGILKKTKVIDFKNPSPLELLVDDFLNKKLKLSLKKSIEHISFMSLFLD